MPDQTTENDIEQLNSLLRAELSAVETYRQCMDRLNDVSLRQRLAALRSSHVTRARKLGSRVWELGGDPETVSGPWDSFAKLAADAEVGKFAAIATLEAGEDGGRQEYLRHINKLSSETRRFLQTEIIPEQIWTHVSLRAIDVQVL